MKKRIEHSDGSLAAAGALADVPDRHPQRRWI